MVRRLLASRRDVFADYTLDGVPRRGRRAVRDRREKPIAESPRILFLLRRR